MANTTFIKLSKISQKEYNRVSTATYQELCKQFGFNYIDKQSQQKPEIVSEKKTQD